MLQAFDKTVFYKIEYPKFLLQRSVVEQNFGYFICSTKVVLWNFSSLIQVIGQSEYKSKLKKN